MYSTIKMSGIAITLIVAIITVATIQYSLNRLLNIMLLNKYIPYLKKWEGGLSRDPSDTASHYPAPWTHEGKNGWHTNKGITYKTFVSNASKLGYAATKENFFEMPDSIWLKILKGVYVSAFPIEKIAHLPRIQAVIIEWSWHSGQSGAERYLANFQRSEMGIVDSNITPDEIVKNFKKHVNPVNESVWFDRLNDQRMEDLSKMASWSSHKNGWTNRVNDFRNTFI